MSFLDHLEELRWHLVRSLVGIVLFAILFYLNIKWILSNIILYPFSKDFPTHRILCQIQQAMCFEKIGVDFIAISPYEQFLKSISISLVGGLIVSFPYVLWEIWRFIRPGLHAKERRGLRGNIFVMSLLFFTGVAFAYYIIVPFAVQFLANYQLSAEIQNQWKIGEVISMITQMVLGGGIVFEMPVILYYLSRMGVVTPAFLRKYRRHAIVILLVIAAVVTPPDWISQVLIFIPLMLLYEISIGISAIAARRHEQDLAASAAGASSPAAAK